MDRENVYKLIDGEREYQIQCDIKRARRRFGRTSTEDLDEGKSIETWILWMESNLDDARVAVTKSVDKIAALEAVRKVAALAVACMEYNETLPRVIRS